MANKDPSDVIIIIRRTADGSTQVAQSEPISVANYTGVLALVSTPITSQPINGAYNAMVSVE